MIVPAGPGDAGGLARVHVRSWRETYQGMLPADRLDRLSVPWQARRWRERLTEARANDLVFVAEGPDEVIGYCAGAAPIGAVPRAEIFTLYLLRKAQGIGLGRALLETTARALSAHGARSLAIWVLAGNEHAQGFYEHLGGVRTARRPVWGWGAGLIEFRYDWVDITRLTRT